MTNEPANKNVIRIMCPNLCCLSVLAVPEESRGRLVRCRSCGTNLRVPDKRAVTEVDEGGSKRKSA